MPDHRHLPTAGPSETTSPNPSTNVLRLDIQGLRAIAVLVVVANHLFKWPQGGYVGVDVFFVVSGYLITGLLLREHARTETISWIGFYKRRIKRIIPAAVTTIFVTCTLAPLALGWSRGVRTAIDGLWALFFVGNWRMYFQDTDYFQRSQLPSPLQHYWSLGVEEQFYTVWPWLLLALMTVLLKVTGHLGYDRSVTAVAITLIGGASFLLAMVQTAQSPSAAYFSSLTRAWELGVGVLVAVASFATVKIPLSLRPILAWAGIAGIIASVLLINDRTPFPGPWAAAPVLSTALVIAVGEGGYPNRYVPILTSGLTHYIGDLSYSIYLAHYPVIILLAGVINPTSVCITPRVLPALRSPAS
ncbi:MAG: acyltransferase [Nocardiaceae bacterium]|nr:acyltransferase [Nocardiaceae bacterium]